MIYLGYHALYGDHGLVSMLRMQDEVERLEYELAKKQKERDLLELKTRQLRPGGLDLDLLDEQSRAMLSYAQPQDLVIIEPGS